MVLRVEEMFVWTVVRVEEELWTAVHVEEMFAWMVLRVEEVLRRSSVGVAGVGLWMRTATVYGGGRLLVEEVDGKGKR